MNNVTQDMKYRQSLMQYAQKHGASAASRTYKLWFRLQKRGYRRCPESLYRTMRRLGMFPAQRLKDRHASKPYEQMRHPIDEFSRMRFLGAY